MGSISRQRELSPGRRVLFTSAMLGATLLVCLALAEFAVREISPQSDLRQNALFFRYEPFVGSEGIPNKRGIFANSSFKTTIVHNARGFRDVEHEFENTRGTFRILTVGDSFTWGHGVENDQIYMKVLEELVPAVETINLGGPGGDPPRELKLYLKHGPRYDHDVLLIGFYMGNDVVAITPDPGGSPPEWGFDDEGRFELIGSELPPHKVSAIRRRAEERFAVYRAEKDGRHLGNFLRRHLQLLTWVANGRDYASEVWSGSVLRARVGNLLGEETKLRAFPFLRYCEPEDPEDVALGWKILRATLVKFKQLADANGARVQLLLIPDMYQTWPDYYDITARRYGYDPAAYDLEKPTRQLVALCADLALACVDLLPRMRAAMSSGERLYYRRDRHWTPAGHRMAAQALAEDLAERGWLRGPRASRR
jgi:hypothetical protein